MAVASRHTSNVAGQAYSSARNRMNGSGCGFMAVSSSEVDTVSLAGVRRCQIEPAVSVEITRYDVNRKRPGSEEPRRLEEWLIARAALRVDARFGSDRATRNGDPARHPDQRECQTE